MDMDEDLAKNISPDTLASDATAQTLSVTTQLLDFNGKTVSLATRDPSESNFYENFGLEAKSEFCDEYGRYGAVLTHEWLDFGLETVGSGKQAVPILEPKHDTPDKIESFENGATNTTHDLLDLLDSHATKRQDSDESSPDPITPNELKQSLEYITMVTPALTDPASPRCKGKGEQELTVEEALVLMQEVKPTAQKSAHTTADTLLADTLFADGHKSFDRRVQQTDKYLWDVYKGQNNEIQRLRDENARLARHVQQIGDELSKSQDVDTQERKFQYIKAELEKVENELKEESAKLKKAETTERDLWLKVQHARAPNWIVKEGRKQGRGGFGAT